MKKVAGRIGKGLIVVFVILNVVAAIHAYKFTHFIDGAAARTRKPGELTTGEKFSALLLGISNPRPFNKKLPERPYKHLTLHSNKQLDAWWIDADNPKGTVILFHGYIGEKSMLLDRADEFLRMGYNTLLVDFMGSGGSEGNQTTIGYLESQEVKTCYDYIKERGSQNVYLYGTSMGTAAVLKSIYDYRLAPAGIIIECPFGTLYQTTCARFRQLQVPVFPMAALLDFWGGVENGFNAFSFSPCVYAKSVDCPVLLLYGARDVNVSRQETDDIYNNIRGKKQLVIFPLAGHENFLLKYKNEWVNDVGNFLTQ